MRIRRRPWARPELAASSLYIEEPARYKGGWQAVFANQNPIHLELGCGKGGFIARMAADHPEVNYMAVDIKSDMLGYANRKVLALCGREGAPPANVRLMSHDIERIDLMLGPPDVVERIYINFCNPWPRDRQHKKRLTHTRWLAKYKTFLADGGEVWFKTDHRQLFEDSLLYFAETGFQVTRCIQGLQPGGLPESAPTEHEEMFRREGMPIYCLVARYLKEGR